VQPKKKDITPEPIWENRITDMSEKNGRTIAIPDRQGDKFRTVECLEDLDPLDELSEYLDVLSNGTRLKILKCLEKKACSTREISQAVESSYENTKKHLDRLCQIGVIKKEAGITDPHLKGVQLYWKYSLVPGGLELMIRNLGLFSHMKMHIVRNDISEKIDQTRKMVSHELFGNTPVLVILGGPDDGTAFSLKHDTIRVGRIDHEKKALVHPDEDLILSQAYSSVSRVTRPHARLVRDRNSWCIEDCGSPGGTLVNKKTLVLNERVSLHDGDLIELSRGATGAKLLAIIPSGPEESGR
jgi:DNA-binding transcriptional ArsR family regulator